MPDPTPDRPNDTILHQQEVEGVIDETVEEGVGLNNPPIADALVDASEAHALNATFSDTEAEAALDALGEKINANGATLNEVLAVLRTNGLIDEE